MRITAIDPVPDNRRGGQERSLYDVLTNLKSLGHDVCLAMVEPGNLVDQYERFGIRCERIDRTWVDAKHSGRAWVELLRSAGHEMFRWADVIYSNQYYDVPVAALSGTMFRKRVVCHLRLPPMPFGFQHRWCRSRIHRYVVANEHMKARHVAAGWPGERISVVPNGFHFPAQSPTWPRPVGRPLQVIYLGRITPEKGVDTAIDVVERLAREGEQITLDIVGPVLREDHVRYRDQLRRRVDTGQLPVRFMEPVEHAGELLPGYDLCIFPSRWDEPFGRVLVEAIMAGVPVLARDVGAIAEILGPFGARWLFRETNDAALKIKEYMRNPAGYPLSAVYEDMRCRYNWPRVMPMLEQALSGTVRET